MTTTTVSTTTSSGAFTETSGNALVVINGGSVSAATIDGGASLTVSSGGKDFAAVVSATGSETIASGGSASGDFHLRNRDRKSGWRHRGHGNGRERGAYHQRWHRLWNDHSVRRNGVGVGWQRVRRSNLRFADDDGCGPGSFTNETVHSGGLLLLANGNPATGTTVLSGGTLILSGSVSATNTVLSGGGTVELNSPKAVLGHADFLRRRKHSRYWIARERRFRRSGRDFRVRVHRQD